MSFTCTRTLIRIVSDTFIILYRYSTVYISNYKKMDDKNTQRIYDKEIMKRQQLIFYISVNYSGARVQIELVKLNRKLYIIL